MAISTSAYLLWNKLPRFRDDECMPARLMESSKKHYPAGTSTSTNVRLTRQKSALFQWLPVPPWFSRGKDSVPADSGVYNFAVAKARDAPASARATNDREPLRLSERIGHNRFMNQPTERGLEAGRRVEKHSNRMPESIGALFLPVGNRSGMASH